jgi:phosphoribosylglycinamide formyltransferase-1
MHKIVFLASSNGGTLKFLIEYIKLNLVKEFNVVHVIADRPCNALEYAKNNSIPANLVRYNKDNRSELLELLKEINPDFVITNIFKILDQNIVDTFENRLINFHYSLLPAFKGFIGIDTLKEARKLNCQFVGSTCHFVDKDVDNGRIISQMCFQLKQTVADSIYTNIMFRANCIMALNNLLAFSREKLYLDSSVKILDETVHYSPALFEDIVLPDENFWDLINSL